MTTICLFDYASPMEKIRQLTLTPGGTLYLGSALADIDKIGGLCNGHR